MTIQEIYQLAIELGKKNDFRQSQEIDRHLAEAREKYQRLPEKEKELFDKERFFNPYSDTRILVGNPEKEVKTVLAGIDIDGDELFLARQMGLVDLVIAHHPRGLALAGLDDVMQLQIDLLYKYGVPVNIAEKILHKRIGEVARSLSPGNHNRVVDLAQHLQVPLITVHTPTDNMVARFLEEKLVAHSNPHKVGDIIDALHEIPEYRQAAKIGLGPKIFVGAKENRAGKIVLTELTGGTEGAPEIYEWLARAGAGTVVSMHQSEKHREEAEKANVNVVIAGHMSSDSIGLNLFLDALESKGIAIIPCSGFIRVSRLARLPV